ncbi:MAG: RsmB/NOP family class I SAM-dependent RNA methyltransferase [Candidatus Micrarchaeota archaeon]|nr:RsmB/NOP family class I SAM-dependent RNA methyltransferase [Candidatus Micrarchaeota archaeon]
MFPEKFVERYRKILGDETEKFLEYMSKPLKKSIRVNTLKIDVSECLRRLEERGILLEKIPWTESGFWVRQKEGLIGYTLEHILGYIYVQEAASMIPPIVLAPREDELILDMAAAPGSKTGQMAEMMNNTGLILANDVSVKRIKSLRFNMEKLGVINVAVIMRDGRFLWKKYPGVFDRVLLDAPCSSEGSIRKDWGVLNRWSPRLVKRMSRLQISLLDSAVRCVKHGGEIVYSTCTLAPEENEMVVDTVLRRHRDLRIEKIKIPAVTRPGLIKWEKREFDPSLEDTVRIYPQDNDTQAFFVAKLVRE